MAKTAKRKPRNRAAQDATLINIRRLKNQVETLDRVWEARAARLSRRIDALELRLDKALG